MSLSKRLQPGADRARAAARAPRGGGGGGQDVLDLEADPAAVRQRHPRQVDQDLLAIPFGQDDRVVAGEGGPAAPRRGGRR